MNCILSFISLPVFQALCVNAGTESQAAGVGEETEHPRCFGEESGSGDQWHDWVSWKISHVVLLVVLEFKALSSDVHV